MKKLFLIAAVFLSLATLYSEERVHNVVVVPTIPSIPPEGGGPRGQMTFSSQPEGLATNNYSGDGSPYESKPPYALKPQKKHKGCEIEFGDYEGDMPVDDRIHCGCWKLYVHYEPRYIKTIKCVEEDVPCKKETCCYVNKQYKVQRCRYIPRCVTECVCCRGCWYQVRRWRYFPEYYTDIECRREPHFWYKDCCSKRHKTIEYPSCEYIPRYYWKKIDPNENCDDEQPSSDYTETQPEFSEAEPQFVESQPQMMMESPQPQVIESQPQPLPEIMESSPQIMGSEIINSSPMESPQPEMMGSPTETMEFQPEMMGTQPEMMEVPPESMESQPEMMEMQPEIMNHNE